MSGIDQRGNEVKRMHRWSRGWRRIAAAALTVTAACVATPLPTPPSVDTERMSLTQADPERVTLTGEERSIQVEGITRLRVTGARAWAEVDLSEFGAFQATIPGALSDTYYLEAILADEDRFLVAISTLAGGGDSRVEERDAGSDRDGDGSPDAVDCDPDDPSSAGRRCESECTIEICDGLDNDCDGEVDEGCDSGTDVDGDGFEAPEDCDDMNPNVNPAAIEICNWIDDDCDGEIDEECEGCGSDDDCPVNASCVTGICTCDAEHTMCSFECVDTDADDANCGDCGISCNTGETCNESICQG